MSSRPAVIIVAILAATASVAPQGAEAVEGRVEPPSVAVTGTGRISARPDVATIHVGVVTQAPSAREALAANTKAMTQLHAILKDQGIASKDIQTTQIQVNPQYSQPRPNPRAVDEESGEFIPRIVGYRVDDTVQITARRIDKLGELLDALVQAGANQIHGISFRVGEPEKLLDEARKRAMADAKRKAELLAGEAGVVLGPPRSIQEEGSWTPTPPPRAFMGAAMAMAPAPVPIASGEQELSVSVRVIYELRLPKSDTR
jgi:uncharacterized protein YggE